MSCCAPVKRESRKCRGGAATDLLDLGDILDLGLAGSELRVESSMLLLGRRLEGRELFAQAVKLSLLVGDRHHLLRKRHL